MNLAPAQLANALLIYAIVLASLTVHEWGHAASADHLGDNTPRSQGRVTLNPLAHIDWIGTVLIPLLGALGVFGGLGMIGWAKPVMINPANLPRTADRAWVTIAGPGMNLMIALGATVAAALAARFAPDLVPLAKLVIRINVGLMVFNLLPVPPLDGSKFLMYWFGMSETAYAQFSRFGWIILMVLINLPQSRLWFGQLIRWGIEPFNTIYAWLV